MLRAQHNAYWNDTCEASDLVCSMTYGARLAQYDPRCSMCWLGHSHTWAKHDESISLRIAQDEQHALSEKIRKDLVWQEIHARIGKTNVNYDPSWASGGIARHGHIVDYVTDNAPSGYAWAWINEPGVYTAKDCTPMSLGAVWQEMKHNDAFEIINLDTREVVCMKYHGLTVFYPQRNIYSIRRKEYRPGAPRRYGYCFGSEYQPRYRRVVYWRSLNKHVRAAV